MLSDWTGADWAALLREVGPVLIALGSLVTALKTRKDVKEVKPVIKDNTARLEKVETATRRAKEYGKKLGSAVGIEPAEDDTGSEVYPPNIP